MRDRGGAYPPLVELTLSRLREFWREPEALFWILVFPILMACALGVAFRAQGDEPIVVGVVGGESGVAATLSQAAGVTDAVPETLEASLQLSEAALVDLGVAMGPVIASIHEKRSELRAKIMEEAELAEIPTLGRRRLSDVQPAESGSKRSTPAT